MMRKLFLLTLLFSVIFVFPHTTSAQQNQTQAKELRAIDNRCTGTLPDGTLCPTEQADQSIITRFLSALQSLFFSVSNTSNFNQSAKRAVSVDLAETPVATKEGDLTETFKETLCGEGNAGTYTNMLPEFSDKQLTEVKDCESSFDNAVFPEGVNVVVP